MPRPDLADHLRTPTAQVRLLVLIGYPTEEIVKAITQNHNLTESDARDMIAAVQEQNLSADEL